MKNSSIHSLGLNFLYDKFLLICKKESLDSENLWNYFCQDFFINPERREFSKNLVEYYFWYIMKKKSVEIETSEMHLLYKWFAK